MKSLNVFAAVLACSAPVVLAAPANAQTREFHIPAGELKSALDAFARQTGEQVIYREDQVRSILSSGVSGKMQAGDALRVLLKDSGFEAFRDKSGAIAIVEAKTPRVNKASYQMPETSDAWAQAGQAPASLEGPDIDSEIVVTARRVEERLQDVPLAITAVRGDALAERGVTDALQLREAVAGLNVTAAAGRTATPIYAIRGQRTADITVTQDPSVAIYVDDVIVTPLHGGNLGLFDLDSVQVLKGPQGTLFGRNTTGGAVLFTTKKPTDKLEGYLKAGYGNYDAKTLQGALNLPVAEGFSVRLAGDYTKTDGFGKIVAAPAGSVPDTYVQPGVGHAVRDRDELSLRLTSLMTPADWLTMTTTVYHSRADWGGPGFRLLNQPNPLGFAQLVYGQQLTDFYDRLQTYGDYDVESSIDPKSRIRLFGVNNSISVELSDDLTLKNIFGYRRTRYHESNDSEGSAIPLLDAFNVTNINQFSNETQLQGKAFDNRLSFILGVYFFDQKGRDFADGTVVFGNASSIGGDVHNSSFSGFGQATYALTDTLNFTAGFRYSVDRRRFDLENFTGTAAVPGSCNLGDAVGNPLPIDQCALPAKTSFARPSWLLSIDKKIGPDTLVYLSHRRGYRSGGYPLRAFDADSLAPFAPETVTDIELGLKSKMRLGDSWSLTSNIAAYYQWYNDVQRPQTLFVSVGGRNQQANIIVNAAKAHIYGGEMELELRSGRFFSLGLNYAYVRPKYDDWPINATVGGVPLVPTNYKDRKFSNIPKHQINANIRISPDLGDVGELNLIGNVYYQSRVVFNDDFQNRAQLLEALSPAVAAVAVKDLRFGQNGYALVNLRAELNNIAGSGLSAAIWAKNVFDKRYATTGNIFYHSLGLDRFTYGDPRTYGFELKYEF